MVVSKLNYQMEAFLKYLGEFEIQCSVYNAI